MRVRTVIAGIFAGWLCIVALQFQYYRIEPSEFVPEWMFAAQAAQLPSWTSTAVLIFCSLTLFASGWMTARWNWADNWQKSMRVGVGMGLIAGCLIFDYIGVFWAGIKGQSEILRNFYIPVPEEVGTRLIIEGVMQTGTLIYLNFALIILSCAAVGGLGGITSALFDPKDFWGSDPRSPEGWLFRLPAYLLSLFGFVNLVFSNGVLQTLFPKILVSASRLEIESGIEANVDPSSQFFQLFSNLALWLFAFLPLGLTWGWILRRWWISKRLRVSSVIWIILPITAYLLVFWYISPDVLSSLIDLTFLGLALLAGIFIGFVTEERAQGFPYRFSDWAGYGLSYGILGGTQVLAGIVPYAAALALITITSIPRLVRGVPGEAERPPVEQVQTLFGMLYAIASYSILGSIFIGLVIAGLLSFFRTIFGVRDAASRHDD